ncbi:MAG: TIGR04255 family protein [Woeseiaceae bacterium]
MSFLLNIPRAERKVFKRHFLSSVHSEIRYRPLEVEKILDKKEELISEFKLLGFSENKDLIHGEFKFDVAVEQGAKLTQKTMPIGIVFSNQSPKCELKIEKDKIVYSDFNYSSFEEFQSRFRAIFEKVSEILSFSDDSIVNKIGFKKINSVAIQPITSFQDSLSIFNAALFGIARSDLFKFDKFKVCEETIVLEETNDKLFILRTRLTKSQEDSADAVIDSDFVKLGKDISIDEVFNEILPSLNQCHFDLFMWSVTDDMRNLMESEQ